jgi:hypothetical protein
MRGVVAILLPEVSVKAGTVNSIMVMVECSLKLYAPLLHQHFLTILFVRISRTIWYF